jgi:hypothetical protein
MNKLLFRRGAPTLSHSSDDDDGSIERRITDGSDIHVPFVPKCANDIILKDEFTPSTLADLVRLSKEDFRVTAYRGRLPKRLISFQNLKLKSRYEAMPGAKQGACTRFLKACFYCSRF